jgi:hypothetical protein
MAGQSDHVEESAACHCQGRHRKLGSFVSIEHGTKALICTLSISERDQYEFNRTSVESGWNCVGVNKFKLMGLTPLRAIIISVRFAKSSLVRAASSGRRPLSDSTKKAVTIAENKPSCEHLSFVFFRKTNTHKHQKGIQSGPPSVNLRLDGLRNSRPQQGTPGAIARSRNLGHWLLGQV